MVQKKRFLIWLLQIGEIILYIIQIKQIKMGQGCTNKPKAIIGSQYQIEDIKDPEQNSYFVKGKNYQSSGDYSQAINSFNKALKANPNSAVSLNGIGNCYLKQGNINEAINYYHRALNIDPNCKFAYNGLGVAYQILREDSNSIESFNKAISIDSNFSYPYNGLGNFYYFRQNYQQALPYYQNALKLDPNSPLNHANVACCEAMMGNYDSSMGYFSSAQNLLKAHEKSISSSSKQYLSAKFMQYQVAMMRANPQYRDKFIQMANNGLSTNLLLAKSQIPPMGQVIAIN